jgi:glycosyltransferase involved in cell wall biosynthesis
LLNAVSSLRPYLQKQIRLVIVGAPSPGSLADHAYARSLKELASRLNLHQRLFWAGYQADPTSFYASMDVLVQPSSAQSGEGMPLAVLEALRQGIPVIASRTGGIPEVICDGANGLLFPPGNDLALAKALQRFLDDDSLRARLRAGTRATFTDRFSLESFQSQTRALIREASGSEAPGIAPAPAREHAVWL